MKITQLQTSLFHYKFSYESDVLRTNIKIVFAKKKQENIFNHSFNNPYVLIPKATHWRGYLNK